MTWLRIARTHGIHAWMLVALLFTQFATAAYVCPLQRVAEQVLEAAVSATCDGVAGDPDQPNLCQAHCQAEASSLGGDLHVDPAVPSTATTWPAARVRSAQPHLLSSDEPRQGAPPGWPALYLIFQVLRD